MMKKDIELIIFGGGGHAKVVLDCISIDRSRIRILTAEDESFIKDGIRYEPEDRMQLTEWKKLCPHAFVAIGDNAKREQVTEKICIAGFTPVTLIHPSAVISKSAVIGKGTLIAPGAVINADAVVGEGCIINSGAIIEHETRIGDFTHISPGAVICGNASVGSRSWICAGAVVANNLSIGSQTIVAAGAAVTKPAGDHVLLAGVPAKEKKTLE